MKLNTGRLVAPIALALWLAAPPTARAQEAETEAEEVDPAAVAEARQRFDRGVELFDAGEYEAALAEFYRAYEIAPNHVVLLNIALAYERYLAEGGDRIAAQRRAEVETTLAALRQRVGRINVTVSRPESAVVYIDDVEVGQVPLEHPVSVGAGPHVVEVRAEGYLPSRREVIVAGEAEVDLEISLTPLAAPAPPQPPAPPPPEPQPQPVEPEPTRTELTPRGRSMRTASWVMMGLAGAALATALGLSIWNDLRYDDWVERQEVLEADFRRADYDTALTLQQTYEDQHNEEEKIAVVDMIDLLLVGLGAAAVVTWAILYFGAPRQPASNVQVSLMPQRDGAFLSLGLSLP